MAKSRTPVKFDHANNKIILYKWFEEKARYPKNEEYTILANFIKSFPNYTITVRDNIKKNSKQEHYKGLKYEYMEKYIRRFEPVETRAEVLKEFEDIKFISQCHSNGHRYPKIKEWFLKKYPEVTTNGMPIITDTPLEKVA